MSNRMQRELDLFEEELEHVELSNEEVSAAVARLPVPLKDWTAMVRAKVADAQEEERAKKIELAREAHSVELSLLNSRNVEPLKTFAAQQLVMQSLLARAPQARVAYLKFESATPEELAEMIKALRYLLGDDES